MDVKKLFGSVLTLCGVGGLIYAAILFSNTAGGARDVKSLLIFGGLGLLFFISGIGLVRTTQEPN